MLKTMCGYLSVAVLIGSILLNCVGATSDSNRVFEPAVAQPDFRLPLPSGKDWGLSVEAGTPTTKCGSGLGGKFFKGDFDCLHSKQGKYSLDFVPVTRQDGGVGDVDVLAAADGTVEAVVDGKDQCYGAGCPPSYGNFVRIAHGNSYTSFYGHLKKNSIPAGILGHPLKRGDKIGIMGTSGYSSGVHVHFEIRFMDQ